MFRLANVEQARKESHEFLMRRRAGEKAPFPITKDGLAILKNTQIVLWTNREFKNELIDMRSACLAWMSEISSTCVDHVATGEMRDAGIIASPAILSEKKELNSLTQGNIMTLTAIRLESDWIEAECLYHLVYLTLSLPSEVKDKHEFTNLREVALFTAKIQDTLRGTSVQNPVNQLFAEWDAAF